ncbi:MAG: hypothetical protein WD512_05615 [Candidatus Paceibacterota bacterium]
MSDNLIELPKLVEEKILSYRKYYILENVSPIIPNYYQAYQAHKNDRFSAIYDERHVGKMVNYLTNIFKKAFEENIIDEIRIQYLICGDHHNTYCDIEQGYEYYDKDKIEETEIIRLLHLFGNLRIRGCCAYNDYNGYNNPDKLEYIIREINMNNNPISIEQTDEQLASFEKYMERITKKHENNRNRNENNINGDEEEDVTV